MFLYQDGLLSQNFGQWPRFDRIRVENNSCSLKSWRLFFVIIFIITDVVFFWLLEIFVQILIKLSKVLTDIDLVLLFEFGHLLFIIQVNVVLRYVLK